MTLIALAIGLVLVVEGLAFALAPSRVEEALRYLAGLTVAVRRMLGLGMVAAGVAILWLVRSAGGV